MCIAHQGMYPFTVEQNRKNHAGNSEIISTFSQRLPTFTRLLDIVKSLIHVEWHEMKVLAIAAT